MQPRMKIKEVIHRTDKVSTQYQAIILDYFCRAVGRVTTAVSSAYVVFADDPDGGFLSILCTTAPS